MASSLGIYIDDTMIKYAKVIKEKDSYKVDSFNVLFYDNLANALEQVINETNSSKLPICTNISNEKYGYVEVFAGLSKQDIKSTVGIEFEMDCNERSYNRDSLEMRYLVMSDKENTEKLKAMYIATDKSDIAKKAQTLGKYSLRSITPTSTSITNLVEVGDNDNIAIVNIEDLTTVTIILGGQIYSVNTVDIGMKTVLTEINKVENSMAKSYDICKNITIYTQEAQSQSEGNEHLEEVMPTLYKIVTEVKKVLDNSFGNVTKIYLTGSGTVINNIDLYFQEYLLNIKCEILRPFFLEGGNVKTSIKDYIEVNSAIALAMNALGSGIKELNYANSSSVSSAVNPLDKIKTMLSGSGGLKSGGKLNLGNSKLGNFKLDLSFKGPLNPLEKLMIRGTAAALIATIGFIGFSNFVTGQIKTKTDEVTTTLSTTNAELAKMDTQLSTINAQTSTYTTMIEAINELNNPTSSSTSDNSTTTYERVIDKDAIPNLLTKIMTKIPQKVKITSIENTEDKKIVIEAESSQYEQLGFFKGLLTTENILANVKSTSGTKDGDVVRVTIEGELP
jgi:hypothetical protein